MKADNRNITQNLLDSSKLAHKSSSHNISNKSGSLSSDLSLFEYSASDIFRQIKNVVGLGSEKQGKSFEIALKQSLSSNILKIDSLRPGQTITLSISIPSDDNFNTTFPNITVLRNYQGKFDLIYEKEIFAPNLSSKDLKSYCTTKELNSSGLKKIAAQIKHFKFHEIKTKLAIFKGSTIKWIKKLSAKTKYHIASFVKYKSSDEKLQKKLADTLGYLSGLGYKFENQHPITTKKKNGEVTHAPGKIKFSKENIRYLNDHIELTSKDQIFTLCSKILASPEAFAEFPKIAHNLVNGEEIWRLLSALKECNHLKDKKPISLLNTEEFQTFVTKIAESNTQHIEKTADTLSILALLKSFKYPLDEIEFTQDGKVLLTSPDDWDKVLNGGNMRSSDVKKQFMHYLEKTEQVLLIKQKNHNYCHDFSIDAHSNDNHNQIWSDFKRDTPRFKVDDIEFSTAILLPLYLELESQYSGVELTKQILIRALDSDTITPEIKLIFTKMLNTDHTEFTEFGLKLINIFGLNTQTFTLGLSGVIGYNPEHQTSINAKTFDAIGKSQNLNHILASKGQTKATQPSITIFNSETNEINLNAPQGVSIKVSGRLNNSNLAIKESFVSPIISIMNKPKNYELLKLYKYYDGKIESGLIDYNEALYMDQYCKMIDRKIISDSSLTTEVISDFQREIKNSNMTKLALRPDATLLVIASNFIEEADMMYDLELSVINEMAEAESMDNLLNSASHKINKEFLIEHLYNRATNGTAEIMQAGIDCTKPPISILNPNELHFIYNLVKDNPNKLDIFELLGSLKMKGYDPKAITVNANGTITLNDYQSWQKITADFKSNPQLTERDNQLLKLIIKTHSIFNVSKEVINKKVPLDNSYEKYADVIHTKIWTDFKRWDENTEINLDDEIKITVADMKRLYDKKAQDIDTSKAMILALSNDPNLSEETRAKFIGMLDKQNEFTAPGKHFISTLYSITQAYISAFVTYSLNHEDQLLNPNDTKEIVNAGAFLTSFETMFETIGEAIKPVIRNVEVKNIANGEFSINASGDLNLAVSGNIENTANGKVINVHNIKTSLFRDLVLQNLENTKIEEALEKIYDNSSINAQYKMAKELISATLK